MLQGEELSTKVLERIKKENIRFLDLQFTDLPGRLQHVTISTSNLSQESLVEGIPKLDGSSIRGFTEIHESDMVLMPDLSTFSIVPWYNGNYKVARLICNVDMGFGKGNFSRDPRYIAQKAEDYVRSLGFDTSYWGPEVEFFVFDKVSLDVLSPFKGQSYSITSKEAPWSKEDGGYLIRFKEGYFPVPPQDTLMDYRNEVVITLENDFGIPCEAHHHEVATAGQCEIDMVRDTLTKMADNVVTLKYVAKNIAYRRNQVATFLPKPIYGDNGSGMHVHVSLWGKDLSDPTPYLETVQLSNLFFDASDEYAELSQLGRYFVGGLLEHSRALSAIVAPTTNSYRRLVAGYEAPIYIAWSKSNRSANVRIPVYEKGEKNAGKKRVEFRTPDPSCNPYLCFASIVAAGLDGIKKKIDPGDPVDENIYSITPERKKQLGIKELPTSLREAVEALKSDSDFLKPIFTDDLIDALAELEVSQYKQVSSLPHPYEFYLYLDI